MDAGQEQGSSFHRRRTCTRVLARSCNDLELLPRFDDGAPFELMELNAGRTLLATRTKGSRSQHTLDIQARYAVGVRNPGVEGAPDLLPIVGGGGNSISLSETKDVPSATRGCGERPARLSWSRPSTSGRRPIASTS